MSNPKLNVAVDELGKIRYLYKIPKNVEICALKAHERVDWVVPGWVALYEFSFREEMKFPIPKLVRDILNHYEIAPSQLMPNMWRILLAFECLSV